MMVSVSNTVFYIDAGQTALQDQSVDLPGNLQTIDKKYIAAYLQAN